MLAGTRVVGFAASTCRRRRRRTPLPPVAAATTLTMGDIKLAGPKISAWELGGFVIELAIVGVVWAQKGTDAWTLRLAGLWAFAFFLLLYIMYSNYWQEFHPLSLVAAILIPFMAFMMARGRDGPTREDLLQAQRAKDECQASLREDQVRLGLIDAELIRLVDQKDYIQRGLIIKENACGQAAAAVAAATARPTFPAARAAPPVSPAATSAAAPLPPPPPPRAAAAAAQQPVTGGPASVEGSTQTTFAEERRRRSTRRRLRAGVETATGAFGRGRSVERRQRGT